MLFFYKQDLYTQREAEFCKKIKQMLSNTLKLNFWYLQIIHILHPRYNPKIKGHILKNIVNIKSVSVWSCLYVLSNIYTTFEAQFMKKVKQHWGWDEEKVAYKKSV